MKDALWRRMQTDNLAHVRQIAAFCHPAFPERDAVLAEKQRLSPQSCLVLEEKGAVAGYLIAHPWIRGNIPALDAFLGQLPPDADLVYLHDIALLPQARGSGHAARGVGALSAWALAARRRALALTAVGGAAPFWRGQGFAPVKPARKLAEKLRTYGDDAVYMIKDRL